MSPIKIHVSADELLLMENFNGGSSPAPPSAPDLDILRDSKHLEQLENWEAIMTGSPMIPPVTQTRQLEDFSLTGENPPSTPTDEAAKPTVGLSDGQSPPQDATFLVDTPPVQEKKYTMPPPNITMASVADLLVPSARVRHLTAPVYPVLQQLKPIVIPQRIQVVVADRYIETPLVPLQELPHVPLQRFEKDESNTHLRNDAFRRFEQRQRLIEHTPDDFYRLVEAYLHFEHALRQAHAQLAHLCSDIEEKRANVWTIDFDTATTTALCGDLKTIEESVEFQTASLNTDLKAALATQLTHVRQLRTAEAALHLYDRALGYLRIEQHVDELVATGDVDALQGCMDTLIFFEKTLAKSNKSDGGNGFVVPTSIRRGQLLLDKDQTKVLVCHACRHRNPAIHRVISCARCDALCFVPQTTIALSSKEWQAAVAQVRLSIQHWLHRCMSSLHTAPDQGIVLSWLLSHLVHLPALAVERQWAVSFVQFPAQWDEATLDLFLAMLHLLFHPPVLPMQYASDVSPNQHEQQDEWLLMEPPTAGELSLSDADYVLLWKQFPLRKALEHCTSLSHSSYSRLLYLVNECTIVFDKFADYDLLVTAVSEGLGLILQTAATHSGSLFDQLFQIGLFGVVMARNAHVYASLPSWNYSALSPSGKWDALSAFFFQPQLPQGVKAFVPFECFLADHPSLRQRLYKEVGRNDALLLAIGVLASHSEWSELVQVIVHELFLCFVATKLMEAHVQVLSLVCTTHPVAMSQILALLAQYEDGVALFPRLPLRLWHPNDADMNVLHAWLMLDNLSDKKSQLARTVLDALNWGYRDDGLLAIHPTLHRQVALLLVEATMHHLSNQSWGRLVTFDFRSWSWPLVLKLQVYSKQYQPYLPLIKLDTDLTKEAMILRRYTKGIPQSHIILGKAEQSIDLKSCISFVDSSTVTTASTYVAPIDDDEDVVPLAQMEPIVLYAVCQLTNHLLSSCIDKYAPLLSLLVDHGRPLAVLLILENILPALSLSPLSQDDVAKFIKNYMEHNNDWRSVVAVLEKNLYFVADASKTTLIQQCLTDRDGSVTINQILPVVLSTLEQSLCLHPAIVPALVDQLPTTWLQYALSSFVSLKSSVMKQNKNVVHEVRSLIQRQYEQTGHTSNLLLYWLVVILGIPKWSDVAVYRELVDTIIHCAIAHNPHALVELETPFSLYLDHMCLVFPTSSLSFISGIAQSSYASMIFGDAKPKEMYLAFLSLLVEIRKEKELFKALGHIVLKSKLKVKSLDTLRAKGRLATELYVFGIDTSQPTLYGHVDLQFQQWTGLKLFKVASFLVHSDHPIDLLLWQLFFALYFASVGSEYFGYMMMELEPKMRKALQGKCRSLSNTYSAKVLHPKSAPTYGELARIFAAMETWLENPDVSSWLRQVDHLPGHYCSSYLKQILGLSQILLHTSQVIEMHTKTIWEEIAPYMWLRLCDFQEIIQSQDEDATNDDTSSSNVVPQLTITAPLPFHTPKYYRFSPIITPDTLGSLQLSRQPFFDRATLYADILSQLMTLEAEFFDHLDGLYQPKHRVINTSRPCDGQQNQPCKRPSALHLEYTEWTVDTNRQERLDQFRVQCAKLDLWDQLLVQTMMERPLYLHLSSLDVQVCYQILLVDQIVRLVTSQDHKEIGVQWFHALVELDSKQTRLFPPFQEVLWRSIKALGMTFIKVDAEETSGLLRFMLQDAARVCLLADCFFPNQTPTRFVEYFANIMYQTEHLDPIDRLELLARFDVALWLEHDPILFDRDTLLSITLAELVLNPAIEKEILRMHAKTIHLLAAHYLDDHIDKILCALLGVYDVHYASDLHTMRAYFETPATQTQALDLSIWQALLNIPSVCWSSCSVLSQLVERVTQFVLHARTKVHTAAAKKDSLLSSGMEMYPILQWHNKGILKPMCDLILVWIKAQPTAEILWMTATKLFEAYLTVLYTPGSSVDATTILGPWPSTEAAVEAAQLMCNALQASFGLYLDLPGATLDCVWYFYLRCLLPHASDALAKNYYAVLSRLPWDTWTLSEETLNEMKDGLTSANHVLQKTGVSFKYQSTLRPHVLLLFRDIIRQVPWSRIVDEYLATQPPHVTSSFYIKYHVLISQMMLLLESPTTDSVFKQCQPLSRPVKVAEVEAICNGTSALVLHPSVLCVVPTSDATPRFYATFRLLLSLCGLDLTVVSGDELKKASSVLHCLSLFLHPAASEWKQTFSAFESTLLGLVQAALHAIFDLLSLLQAQLETIQMTFKAEHIAALLVDVFKLCNLPLVAQATSQPRDVCAWMELEAKLTNPVPVSMQECTMLSMDKCNGLSLVGWQMLWQFAGLSKSLGAICQAVASVSILSQLTERHLDQWKMATWTQLKLPELSQEDLVAMSLKQQCWLTLVAVAKSQRVVEEDIQRQLQTSMRMNEWMEEIAGAPRVAEEAKLIGLVVTLLKRQLYMPSVALSFKRDMLARMSKACWAMGDARLLSNGLDAVQKAMGFNFMNSFGKLKYGPDLHAAMLALCLFMRVNSRKAAALRLDYGAPLEVSKKTSKLIKSMEGMTERKDVLQWSITFCLDPKHCLRDVDEFVKVLISELFPNHVWLLSIGEE
ncbi:unnamed protein product [Aphanomyces euteiches]